MGPASPPAEARQGPVPATPPSGPDGFQLAEEQGDAAAEWPFARRAASRRVILAYCLGAAAYASVITTLKFLPESSPLPAVAWLVDWWTQTWPILPTLVALLVLDRPLILRLALFYVGGGALAIALFTAGGQLLRGTLNSAPLTNVFWALRQSRMDRIDSARARRHHGLAARAGGDAARAGGTLLFGLGSMFFRELLIRAMNLEAFRSLFLSGAVLYIDRDDSVRPVHDLSLPVGWIAWRLLTVLANAFATKRFSDVQLVIDCWWAVAAAEVTATTLSITHGLWGIVGGIAAFAAYRLTVFAVLRGYRPPDAARRRLLLLRVFGYQARTESLFDRVAQAWRFHGPVQLIAGVDLAMRTVDPGDLLALLNGRLAELYVRAPRTCPSGSTAWTFNPIPTADSGSTKCIVMRAPGDQRSKRCWMRPIPC